MPEYAGEVKMAVTFDVKDAKQTAKDLEEEIEKIFDNTAGEELGDKFNKIKDKMDETTRKANQLITELEQLEQTKTPTKEFDSLTNQLTEYQKKIDDINKELSDEEALKNMNQDHKLYLESYLNEYTSIVKSITDKIAELEKNNQTYIYGKDSADYTKKIDQLADLNNKMRELITQSEQFQEKNEDEPKGFKKLLTSIGIIDKEYIKMAETATRESPKLFEGFDVKKLLRNVMRYGLGIRSIYILVSKLRQAIKEGMNNLARWNNGNNSVNKSMTELTSSLAQLKNNVGAAFAPILTTVEPILTRLIGLLNSAANAVAMFFAKISGKSTYVRAIKQNKDYAKSLGGVGGAAGKAANNLAAFDDLMVLDDNSGGSSGGADYNSMFEEVPLEETLSTWLEDTEAFGKMFGETIYNGFVNFDWQGLGETVGNAIAGIFAFLEGFIEGINWAQLPMDIWNAIIQFFEGFIASDAINRISEFIGALFGAAVQFFVFGIPQLINSWITAVQEYFEVFIEQAKESGKSWAEGILMGILTMLSNIDKWIDEHILQPFITGFKKAFGIHSPSTVMEEQGELIIEGLLVGLQNLWGRFVEWFTQLKNTAVEIVTSMKNKIVEKWEEMKNNLTEKFAIIRQNAISLFTSMKEKVKEIFDNLWTGIKKPINSVLGGVESMANGVINAINSMIRALNQLSFSVPDWVPVLGGKTFGLSIPTIPAVTIPKLAEGAVIPPNREFLAVLGDQKRGNNLEMPEDLLRDILRDELATNQQNNNYAEMELDGQVFARLIVPYVISELDRRGFNVNILEV